jgi:hypothetical protein
MSKAARVLLAVLLLAAGACSSGDTDEGASPTEPSTSTAPEACDVGTVPEAGQVTYVGRGRLYGVAPGGERRCLVAEATGVPQWNGTGEKVIFEDDLVLSRPEGKSVLRIDAAGRLLKRPADGGEERDITFLDVHEEVLYHPAGRHIASAGRSGDTYGIFLAGNEGLEPRLVTQAEGDGSQISDLAWTESGALVFSARHGGQSHVHRLDLATLELTTLDDDAPAGVLDIAASRFTGAGLAWSERTGSSCSLSINRAGRSIPVPEAARATTPVGWLPGGVLVVRGCSDVGSHLLLSIDVADQGLRVAELAAEAGSAAVRVALPSAPELVLADPIESEAPV